MSGRSAIRQRSVSALAILVLVGSLSLTALVAGWLQQNMRDNAQMRFERHVQRLEDNIRGRFVKATYGLSGLRSTFLANGGRPLDRAQFRTWMMARNIPDEFPGIRGLGFIERVERIDLDAFMARERADGAPDFAVRTTGQAPNLFVIKLIEPLTPNRAAWGYDVGSEAIRREAAERAIDTGAPALTGHITLLQDAAKRQGFLYVVPVFKSADVPPSVELRRQQLVGLLYAPIVLDEFLADVVKATDQQLAFQLYDAITPLSTQFIVNKVPASQQNASHLYAERTLHVGGRDLTLRMRTTAAFETEVDRVTPASIGLFGIVLSVMMAMIVWLLGMGRARAEALAQSMTADIQRARAQAEAALRDTRVLLDTLSRYMLITMSDPQGRITEVNDAFCEASGYRREELIDQSHSMLKSGVQSPESWRAMWETITSGQPWRGEICNLTKDGQEFWLQSIIAPMFNAQGNIERYISICAEITQNKRVQQELAKVTERYALATDGGDTGLWECKDLHKGELWWSPQHYRLIGYEPGDFTPSLHGFIERLHPDDQTRIYDELLQAADKAGFDIDFRLQTRTEGYRWFRSRAKVFRDDAGTPVRMAGIIRDVHDHRMALVKIQEHGDALHAIFSLSPDGFVAFRKDGTVGYVSPAFCRLTHLSADDVTGLNESAFLTRLMALSKDPLRLPTLTRLSKEHAHERMVIEMKPPLARMLECQLHEGHGEGVNKVLHLRDVTHETEVDAMKSEFMSMAAHELRTPMASIYGFTELILKRKMSDAMRQDMLESIYRQSQAMIKIINELLDLARIEARRGSDFQRVPVDLTQALDAVVRDFKPPEGRDAPVMGVPTTMQTVLADPDKLRQAIVNILSNAYKYSPQGGAVEIDFPSKNESQPWVGIRISDHGMGLTPEQLAHVGERFYRADKSGNIPGTGLGVSIVKQIMELMDGHLDIQSTPGAGTQVTLWLPAMPAQTP